MPHQLSSPPGLRVGDWSLPGVVSSCRRVAQASQPLPFVRREQIIECSPGLQSATCVPDWHSVKRRRLAHFSHRIGLYIGPDFR